MEKLPQLYVFTLCMGPCPPKFEELPISLNMPVGSRVEGGWHTADLDYACPA